MGGVFKPSSPKGQSLSQVAGTRGTGLNFSSKTSKKIMDPLGLKKDSPKTPDPTAEEIALGIRQRKELDKEIATSEKKLKAMARGTLGRQSLLSGGTPEKGMTGGGRGRGGRGGAGSLLSGGGSGGGSSSGGGAASAGIGGGMRK